MRHLIVNSLSPDIQIEEPITIKGEEQRTCADFFFSQPGMHQADHTIPHKDKKTPPETSHSSWLVFSHADSPISSSTTRKLCQTAQDHRRKLSGECPRGVEREVRGCTFPSCKTTCLALALVFSAVLSPLSPAHLAISYFSGTIARKRIPVVSPGGDLDSLFLRFLHGGSSSRTVWISKEKVPPLEKRIPSGGW